MRIGGAGGGTRIGVAASLVGLLIATGCVQTRRAPASRPSGILVIGGAPKSHGFETLDIFRLNPDGTGRLNLTRSSSFEFDPVWAPDRQWIAFAALNRVTELKTDIYVMKADGSERRRVTDHGPDTIAGCPTWSPDGKHIAFHAVRGDPSGGALLVPQILVIDADGRNRRRLARGLAPAWSPDGRRILYFAHRQVGRNARYGLSVMNVDGSDPRLLKREAGAGVWSPDGKRIAYINLTGNQRNIFVMNVDGTNATRLTNTPRGKMGVQWASDGTHVIFTDFAAIDWWVPVNTKIFRVDVNKKKVEKLGEEGWTCGGVESTLFIQTPIALYRNAPPDVKKRYEAEEKRRLNDSAKQRLG
jgi:dipeptidyl aminopeptidase/acylaminoacyl peptidase